jgi:sulfur carrier protein ThiS
MKVTLQLKGPLTRYGNGSERLTVDLEEESVSVRNLLDHYKIPASSVSFIQVNNIKADLDHILKEGELLTVNPRVAGG